MLLFLLPLLSSIDLQGQSRISSPSHAKEPNQIFLLEINGTIGPATSDYFEEAIQKAHQSHAHAIILKMDTPGGLDTSMRSIIKTILSSKIPIITYVAPEGSRAASAGTYILYASHIAAMSPATNLGAATPVNLLESSSSQKKDDKNQNPKENKNEENKIQSTAMDKKIINDANAYIRGLAKLRGRNQEWASRAVIDGESLPAEEALEKNVIELMASNLDELLKQLDGRSITFHKKTISLQTQNAKIVEALPNWQNKLLSFIASPSLAYLLILIGFYGLIYEFSTPGSIGPGVAGVISILVGFYGLHILPINYFGIALIILGLGMMLAEAFVPSFGALGAGGIVAFILGSFVLIDAEKFPELKIPRILIFSLAGISALFVFVVSSMAIGSKKRKVASGSEEMVGSLGEAIEDFEEDGNVWIHGELWRAHSRQAIKKSQIVRVVSREGLELEVEPYDVKNNNP